MTNNQHGQVPDTLIDLIDAYAETRHRCGGIYNARTEAARKAVIEALSGVQALSAAPAIGDELRDRLVAISKAIADQDDRTSQAMLREILAAPQPAPLTAAAGQRRSDLAPGVMHCAKCKFQLNRITLCVSDGNAYAGNNETEPCPNGCGPLWPVTWEQEARNCWKALEEMHERLHPAPTPPAEQQAQPGAVYAELPQPDSWFHFTAQFWENKLRDFADRTHALRMEQATPKAAPGATTVQGLQHQLKLLAEALGACILASGIVRKDIDGFDGPQLLLFAEDLRSMLEAAPGEQNTVPAEWLEQAYREGWAACRDAEIIGEEAEDWAFGNSTANSRMIDAQQAAPKQEVQEPVAWQGVHDQTDLYYTKPLQADVRPLYAAPQPAPAELERLRERIARMGLDVDRAMRGHVNEQSPLGTQRLAAIAALVKPKPAPLSEMPYEKRKAIQEGEQISASDAWFHARFNMLDTLDRRNVFRAGFDRGWNAALAAQGGSK